MSTKTEQPFSKARDATFLSFLTILSPISGLGVEMSLAWLFGSSGTVDAYRLATFLLLMGNQLFIGQLLPNVLVPLVSEFRSRGEEEEGWKLALSLVTFIGAISALFSLWVFLFPNVLVNLLGPGLAGSARHDAILLFRYFSIAFSMLVWSGIMGGMLYAYRIFWLPIVSQILINILVVVLLLCRGHQWGIHALAIGITSGYLLMFLLHLIMLTKLTRTLNLDKGRWFHWASKDVLMKAVRLAWPLMSMVFLLQWSNVILNRALSALPRGTLANYGYAWKLLIVVGVMPSNLVTVVFPAISDAHAHKDFANLGRLIRKSMHMLLFLTMPVAAVMYVLRQPILMLVLQRGAMSIEAITEASSLYGILLWYSTAGLLIALLQKIFFSMQNTKLPAYAEFLTAILNTIFLTAAARHGGAAGVAWTTTAISWTIAGLLMAYSIIHDKTILLPDLVLFIVKLTALCAGIVFVSSLIQNIVVGKFPATHLVMLIEVVVIGGISALLGYVLSKILRIEETNDVLDFILWKAKAWFKFV